MASGEKPGLYLKGDDAMRRRLLQIAAEQPRRMERALYRRGVRIMSRSQDEFVPVDLGTLKGSGGVQKPQWSGKGLIVVLYYGGAASDYALAVHEHLSVHSPRSWRKAAEGGSSFSDTGRGRAARGRFTKGSTTYSGVAFHPSGRGPKYLERPLFEASRTLLQDMVEDLRPR